MKNCKSLLLSGLIFLALNPGYALADSSYTFSCESSQIKGSIKYSVIGKYLSDFGVCSGIIVYDELEKEVKSVQLNIETRSIHSSCGWCDKIVVSKKLLDANQYPQIVFRGETFEKDDQGHWVQGYIDLHGVRQNLRSEFSVKANDDGSLFLSGTWTLRRKDFGIVWNKVLDHGGVLVGDHITVDWVIQAQKLL